MDTVTKTNLPQIRILAAKSLQENHGIKLKLKPVPSKKPPASHKPQIFGVPLEILEQIEAKIGGNRTVMIPKVFHDLCTFVRKELDTEGIFRVEGSKVKQKKIINTLDAQKPLTPSVTVIDASAVIKSFLRNLPETVIPNDYTKWFVEAYKVEKSKEALLLAVLLLPLEHLYFLVYLMQFCQDVTANSSKNKMDAHNMAVVMSPNIFSQTIELALAPTTLQITKIFIENANSVGEVPGYIKEKLALNDTNNNRKKSTSIFKKICGCCVIL